jgi:acetyl-CoA C-acetyltransferase
VALAYQAIALGDSEIVLAGGQENMSLSRHATYLRKGVKMGSSELVDMMLYDGLTDVFNNYLMGVTAENIAVKYGISREEQDAFACNSQNKAEKARTAGHFAAEIIPVEITDRKETRIFDQDEFIRAGVVAADLAKLKPAFQKEGTVTAANASGINDGAAALLVVNEAQLAKYNLTPCARIVSWGQAAVDPKIMGIGPVGAVNLALKRANWNISDLDVIEANEAFAAQAIAVNRELKWNTDIVNISGGAIAIGHPIGASGARILVTLLHNMKRTGGKKGLATLCVGGGMGVAMCVERV